jgi:hypothetical protein
MIKHDRSIWTNPYREHTRQNGVTRGRQDWSDLQDTHDQLDAGSGIIHAMILGFCVWGLLGVVILLLLRWI